MADKRNILVCGGAGYIGSHLVKDLVASGYFVVVFDNLSAGHIEALDLTKENLNFIKGDIRNKDELHKVFSEHKIDAVFHMCASIVVSESVSDPLKYFDNNVSGTVTLLQTMKEFGVKFFVFSSTAAVFGMPDRIPIHEDDKKFCLNPYGDSKYFVEQILERCDIAYGMKYTILRYFNACGAHPDGTVGECHDPETHLIPLVLQVPLGKRPHIKVFGTDYPTEDGTCIRDYVHVSDLSTVHILALEQMIKTGKSDVFNLGNGKGYSVLEIIDIARKVTGHAIPVVNEARRDGDAAVLVASSEKTEKVLGWKPKFGLKEIIESAWNFHKGHKDGFKTK